MVIKMNYSSKMKKTRLENGHLQKNIAEYLEISPFTYSHYETKDNIIPINHLIKFCDFYNVSLDYIFDFNNVKQYDNSINEVNSILAGKRLKEFRKDNKLTQNKLAELLNTNQSVVANYERGRNIIATPFLYEICSKYNISADYLLGKIDSPKYLNNEKI